MSEEIINYANAVLEMMRDVREEVATKEIPEDVKKHRPEILLETFHCSVKELIQKSIRNLKEVRK